MEFFTGVKLTNVGTLGCSNAWKCFNGTNFAEMGTGFSNYPKLYMAMPSVEIPTQCMLGWIPEGNFWILKSFMHFN